MKSATSLIEEHEESEAIKVVTEQFKDLTGHAELPRPCGYKLAVKIYIRPEELKTIDTPEGKKTLYLPHQSRDSDKWTNCVGLVVGVGPGAYKGKNPDGSDKYPEGPWCKIGDWVIFPRYESQVFMWRGVAMMNINDDAVQQVVGDPRDVQAGHTIDKY